VKRAAAVVVLLVAGCGGGDDKPSADKPSAAAAKAGSYEVDLPSGWSDRTRQISNQDNPIRFDRVFVTSYEDGFRTNVSVVRQRKSGGVSLDAVAKASQRQTRDVYGASGFKPPRSTKVDGEDARAYTYLLRAKKKRLRGEQVIAEHGGRFFYITFTAQGSAYERRLSEFEQMLGSWHWK
jgi:hypothetical protein